jgi:hypothetical protein
MKARTPAVLLALGLFASSCALDRQVAVSNPIGPPPDGLSTSIDAASDGTLVVYSSYGVGEAPTDYDASMRTHTPYDIRTVDGALVKHVGSNHGGRFDGTPDAVSLPVGRYQVSATAQEYGRMDVPVEIVAGRTTTVHLDSNEAVRAQQRSNTALIRLPDGQIVGWREAQPAD